MNAFLLIFVNHMHSFLLVLTHLDNEASNLEETVNDEGDSKCGNCGQCGIGQPSVIVVIVIIRLLMSFMMLSLMMTA